MTCVNKKMMCFTLIFIVILCSLISCAQIESQTSAKTVPTPLPLPTITAGNFPLLDGSTSTTPLSMLIFCQLMDVPCEWVEWLDGTKMPFPEVGTLNLTEDSFPSFGHHGTHGSYLNLISGKADLIFVARLPSADELHAAAAMDVKLIPKPIALDAFVFILNFENPIDSLSLRQIQEIYMGHIADWNEVGGWDATINPYQRNDNSGSQELMRALVMQDLTMIHAPEMMLPTMMAPINAISSDPNGIGYSVYYYEQFMAPSQELKLCGVDGVVPSFESIQSREYPFTTEVYAVVRSDLPTDSVAYRLMEWVLSAEGQAVVAESGYVPLE